MRCCLPVTYLRNLSLFDPKLGLEAKTKCNDNLIKITQTNIYRLFKRYMSKYAQTQPEKRCS